MWSEAPNILRFQEIMNIRHVPPYRPDLRCCQQEIEPEEIMTTTTNINKSANTATQNNNNRTEEGTMNHTNNNINLVARISNAFRMENVSKLVATAAVGLALTIGVGMHSQASADNLSVTNLGSQLASNYNDDFSLVFGTPDAPSKLRIGAANNMSNDDFSLMFGTPDAPAKLQAKSSGIVYNDDFSMVFGIADIMS
jgi:hypothetical protein